MTDERRINEIEEMLREAGAPMQPPASFHAVARAAALGEGDVVPMRSRVRPRGRTGRLMLAAAVLTASAAAALVIGVGGNRMSVARSISLGGSGASAGATAVVDIGSAGDNPIRQVRVRVQGLDPAPEGRLLRAVDAGRNQRGDRHGRVQHAGRRRRGRTHQHARRHGLDEVLGDAGDPGRPPYHRAAPRLRTNWPPQIREGCSPERVWPSAPAGTHMRCAVYLPPRSRT